MLRKELDYPAIIHRQLHGDYPRPPKPRQTKNWKYYVVGVLRVILAMLCFAVCLVLVPLHAFYKMVVAILFRWRRL